eukprot:g29776.t1
MMMSRRSCERLTMMRNMKSWRRMRLMKYLMAACWSRRRCFGVQLTTTVQIWPFLQSTRHYWQLELWRRRTYNHFASHTLQLGNVWLERMAVFRTVTSMMALTSLTEVQWEVVTEP